MASRLIFAVAVLAFAASACAAGPGPAEQVTAGPVQASGSAAASDPLARLRRPWVTAPLRPGEPCPVTTESRSPDPAFGPVLGGGPVGPVGLDPGGVLRYSVPESGQGWGDWDWGWQKVMWAVDPAVTTPVLVRGRRLDSPGEVGFDDPVVRELVLDPERDAAPGGWRDHPSATRVRAPGCYAYQADTDRGSFAIVFRAVGPVMTPAPG
ncbi:hypothetical protein ACFFMN_10300 [Planobispora siamensis]|uniref:Secreted protein n=1 Tax=Planobispora siamensis TaxID=936338 RepID=A0A8J3SBG6_9ACTN|nr:hypothetical protein [Planobispora siamensis]GIH90269.1 hypothetical protein Psi01_08990 [Planobispora siamensis]